MREIEVKIFNIDKEKIISRLEQLGAQRVFDDDMKSTVFERREDELKKSSKLLRLRQKGDKIILTAKEALSHETTKQSNEYEVEVSDFELMRKILTTIGFIEKAHDARHRTSYKIKNSLVEIDSHEKIPTWLEVESPSEEELKEIVEIIGFSMKDTSTATMWDLYKKYNVN
jgi:adenylate cyclase, class 2